MRSTFMGLETAKRGMFTQQSALYTTGHNISNANTLGYTRQRVNFATTTPYPAAGLNRPQLPGQMGTGVEAESVQRIRDAFIDRQYRQESNKLGYWESRSTAISQMEDILTEPSEYGLNESLNQFWKSLQDLSTNPENGGVREVAVQRGIAVAESFNYIHKQISDIQGNLANEIGVSTKDINSILNQIASLNDQIQQIEPSGLVPNDLYDSRDNLLDELSSYYPIDVKNGKSGGNASPIAEGPVTVSLKLNDGTLIELVNGKTFNQFRVDPSNPTPAGDGITPTGPVTQLRLVSIDPVTGNDLPPVNSAPPTIALNTLSDSGKIKSLINSYGDGTTAPPSGYYPKMLGKLDQMAKAFAEAFNKIHANGNPLPSKTKENDFFEFTAGAADIKVRDAIIDDPGLINASSSLDEEGNGANALLMANMKFVGLSTGTTHLNGATVQTFYQSVIGQLGVDGEQANRLKFNSETIKQTVENNRASVSAVSLDEEMTNMVTFQHAYNASARMITVVDEVLDKIINGMGRAGL